MLRSPVGSLNIFAIIVSITPSLLILAGAERYIGVSKVNVAISISLSTPTGMDLLLKETSSRYTAVKLVQST